MNRLISLAKVAVVVTSMLTAGCAFPPFAIEPSSIPAPNDASIGKWPSATLALANSENDISAYYIPIIGRPGTKPFSFINRKALMDTFLHSLANELAARGVTVDEAAAKKVVFTLTEITQEPYEWGGMTRMNVKITVKAGAWAKTYSGTDFSASGSTVKAIIIRATSYALTDAMKQMITDGECIAALTSH